MIDDIHCHHCQGNGLPPGNAVDANGKVGYCSCWPKRMAQWAIPKANIYRKYQGATLDLFSVFPNEKFLNKQQVVDACRAYVANWDKVKRSGRCLSILGDEPGMGKSYIASAICNYLIENFWTLSLEDQDVCLFVNVSTWFGDWATLYARYPDEKSRYEEPGFLSVKKVLGEREARMRTTELLVLDDLTKFDKLDKKKTQKLFDIIENRVINGLPIVVTENAASWDQVAAKLGMEHGAVLTDRLIRNGDTLYVQMPVPESKRGKKKTP